MGYKNQQSGDLDKALSFYSMAVGLDPYYAAAHNDLGIIYEMKGLFVAAEKKYLKTIYIDPKYLSAYTNLAYLYEKRGDISIALLTTILQIVHWFNPVLWFAFYKMRLDREKACDELALSKLDLKKGQFDVSTN